MRGLLDEGSEGGVVGWWLVGLFSPRRKIRARAQVCCSVDGMGGWDLRFSHDS